MTFLSLYYIILFSFNNHHKLKQYKGEFIARPFCTTRATGSNISILYDSGATTQQAEMNSSLTEIS